MASEYTPNYNLDLYVSTDRPNLRDQYNAAMGKIDTQMKSNADSIVNANASIGTLQTQMGTANESISALTSKLGTANEGISALTSQLGTANEGISALTSKLGTANSDIGTLQTQMGAANQNISALGSTVEKHGTQITDVKQTADSALSLAQSNESRITTLDGEMVEVQNGKAPTNHASADNTYGQGSPTSFGHVKVVDSGSEAASSGVAASPAMVKSLADSLTPVPLYFSETGGTSVQLSQPATNYRFLEVEVASAQGNRTVLFMRPVNTSSFVVHGVTGGTMWVAFGTVRASGSTVSISSQMNMPISAFEFKTGENKVDCKIVSVRGITRVK